MAARRDTKPCQVGLPALGFLELFEKRLETGESFFTQFLRQLLLHPLALPLEQEEVLMQSDDVSPAPFHVHERRILLSKPDGRQCCIQRVKDCPITLLLDMVSDARTVKTGHGNGYTYDLASQFVKVAVPDLELHHLLGVTVQQGRMIDGAEEKKPLAEPGSRGLVATHERRLPKGGGGRKLPLVEPPAAGAARAGESPGSGG